MAQIPKEIEEQVRARILDDLQPPVTTRAVKSGVALTAGGLLSMQACGQFGVGWTAFAIQINHSLHEMGLLTCAVVCGALFAVVPVIALRLICSLHQFRAIACRDYWSPALWLLGLGGILSWHGTMGSELLYMGGWLGAAYVAFKLLSEIVSMIEPFFSKRFSH